MIATLQHTTVIWYWFITMVSTEFKPLLNVYMTDRASESQLQNNCFYYHVTNTIISYKLPMRPGLEIIEYCLRPLDEMPKRKSNFSSNITIWTFDKLREKQITSKQLYEWSAPIDTIERYQDYLNNFSVMMSTQLFYNCTPQFFGQYCEYSFDWYISFPQVVTTIFQLKEVYGPWSTNFPCYIHLPTCYFNHSIICLDWREMCDRKLHCDDGVDEYGCFSLEFNVCGDDEFQCQNGQCIPIELYHDDRLNPDCLDGTDEKEDRSSKKECYLDPAFRCEEHGFALNFVCGDGSTSDSRELTFPGFRTSNCVNERDQLLETKIFSYVENGTLPLECWKAMIAFLRIRPRVLGEEAITLDQWVDVVERKCDPMFVFPSLPFTFEHVSLIYTSDRTYNAQNRGQPRYVCFNVLYCPFLTPIIEINGSTCISVLSLNLNERSIDKVIGNIFRFSSSPTERNSCNNSETMYQCRESLNCISSRRLSDGVEDCYGGDDEKANFTCLLKDKIRIPCPSGDKCVSHLIVGATVAICLLGVGNEYFTESSRSLSFPIVCDGFVEINLHKIADIFFFNSIILELETDETHCEEWPCDNIYTRCDGFWNCVNGADELNCPLLNSCAPTGFECLSPKTFNIICLPAFKAGDGLVDCIGGTDERFLCRRLGEAMFSPMLRYRCWNSSTCIAPLNTCDRWLDCPFRDDEKVCEPADYLIKEIYRPIRIQTDKFLNGLIESEKYERKVHFSLTEKLWIEVQPQLPTKSHVEDLIINKTLTFREIWLCNRGIPFFFYQRKLTDENIRCLCPVSYYGDRCQFQSQRADISFRLRTLDFRTVFELVIMLIDNTSQIHSHAQRELLPMRDCDLRIDVTLLYSQRPKNESVSYMIRIDTFDKVALIFRASWLFRIKIPVLPVYRISTIITLPSEVNTVAECSEFGCVNGDCVSTVNTGESFCRCFEGWSEISCKEWIGHCNCASNSICVGSSNNRSICVCPLGMFGSRCFLTRSSCQPNPCMNGAICVPADVRISEYNFTCLCKEGFTGTQCQYIQSQIEISFSNVKPIPLFLYIHFITVMRGSDPLRATILKRIAYDQDSTVIYISDEFNIAFVEFDKLYYLIILQATYKPSHYHKVIIQESSRCPSIDDLLNSTVLAFEILRRIKYYNKPCQERLTLGCFYDDDYMCLCTDERHANCLLFNHTMKYTCQGLDYCQNGAQCFQNNPNCPSSINCICSECFYGSKCQFKTEGMSLSLDAIVGYQIRPNMGINQQSRAVKMSSAIIVILFVLGMINSTLSLITFQRKKCQIVGCGLYLLSSSIVSLLISIILVLKFIFLLLIQTRTITNRSFLMFNCMTIDVLLNILLSITDWLNAIVAVERCIMLIKNVKFDKKKKQAEKWQNELLLYSFSS
jgi:hypothetical protein